MNFACGLKQDGTVFCWAMHGFGYAFNLESDQGDVPDVRDIVQMESAGAHSCGRTEGGHVRCWGSSTSGAVGGETYHEHLATVAGIENARTVSVSGSRSCALLVDSSVRCWGGRTDPIDVSDMQSVKKLFAGVEVVCGLLEDGRIDCRGDSFWFPPANEQVVDFHQNSNACFVTQAGDVKCWGRDHPETRFTSETPVSISGVSNATHVQVNDSEGCALTEEGRVFCWSFFLGDSTLKARELVGFD